MMYHFFWGGPLSQWCRTHFKDTVDNTFYSCEQYMMYQKAMLFRDYEIAEKILKTKNPRTCKALGRKVQGFSPDTWGKYKRQIVFAGNMLRATQDEQFRQELRATGTSTIVEASPYDRIWGIGYDSQHAIANKSNWGQNLLGEALMKVRAQL